MSGPPNNWIPSSRRPVPLRRRGDLVLQSIGYQGNRYWVVKDPIALAYHRLQQETECVLRLLDGRHSLEEIREAVQREFPYAIPSAADIQQVVIDLHSKGLLVSDRPGQGVVLLRRARERFQKRLWSALGNVLSLRLPGWDPDNALRTLSPVGRWLFRPWVAVIGLTLAALSCGWLAVHFDEFRERLPGFQQFFAWPNLMYLWATLAVTKLLHELGHGLACRHFGGECHQIGVIFLLFTPTLYCDVSDSWMLRSKWQRIVIGAAGMYAEMLLSTLALWVWWLTHPGLLNHLCLNVFFVSTVTTVAFNVNPLMRYDGYYMLADYLEIPNLAQKASRMLQETFAHQCLGIDLTHDPFSPERGRFWFVAYALASAAYRWVVLLGIALFLYTVLKPYGLQHAGPLLAVTSAGVALVQVGRGVASILRTPCPEPIRKRRIVCSFSTGALLLAGVLFLPIPWHWEAGVYLEPFEVRHVHTTVPGELSEICVRPGDRVAAGMELARLTDIEKGRRFLELQAQHRVQEQVVAMQRALEDPAQVALAVERLQAIAEQRDEQRRLLNELSIKAPIGGVVIEPPRMPEPKRQTEVSVLPGWSGTPLDRENAHCALEAGTHLLSLAPDDRFQAVLLVDQGDRNDIDVGSEAEIRLEHLPHRTFHGTIREISERHAAFSPRVLSNKAGGEVPTVTDERGRERLMSHAYYATVLLESDTATLKSGLRGKARVGVGHRSTAAWLWRWLRATFHFRL